MIQLDGDFLRAVLGKNQVEVTPETAETAFRAVGLLRQSESLLGTRSLEPWHRGGAESYVCTGLLHLRLASGPRLVRSVIVKAYAGFGLGVPPEARIEEWAIRSHRLSEAGCPVSEVYGTHDGLLFAEHIPYNLIEFLSTRPSSEVGNWAAASLQRLTATLDRYSVEPVALLADLRTDGEFIYIVDFGEDLGPVPGPSRDTAYCRRLMARELAAASLTPLVPYFLTSEGHNNGTHSGDTQA